MAAKWLFALVTHGSGPNICITGARSSGLMTAKVLKRRGLPFDCFEKGSERCEHDNGVSSAYRSLHIDRNHAELSRRFVESPRYALGADFRSYVRALAQDCRERRAGA